MSALIFLKGAMLGASLIVAIGPQNAFILRQGLQRRHVFLSAAIGTLVDAGLILIGVSGLALALKSFPQVLTAIRWAGAAFLFLYGVRSFNAARRAQSLETRGASQAGAEKTAITLLGFSLLNPHVYLDTVLLLGGIGASYGAGRFVFAAGAMGASAVWFFGLAYGARFLAPLFARPRAWQVLDLLIGVVMWSIAASLIFSA